MSATNTVSFRNRGLIELRSIRTFGVSAKECDNPIGFFGTGLKYAIAICLRMKCKVVLFRGLERYEFATSDVAIRNGEFSIVTMNGEEIGFTTDLGKTWEPWQAYREIHCNTTDEGGEVIEGSADPLPDHTTIVVTGSPFYSAYLERGNIILTAPARWRAARAEIHERTSAYAYYRGIRVAQLQDRSCMTYNVLSNLDLTEDRTLKNIYQFYSAVREALLNSDDADFVSRFLQAPSPSFEASLDLDCWSTPSELFLQTLERITFKRCTNNSALKLYKKHRKDALAPDSTPLNRIEKMQLDRAVEFCSWAGYRLCEYEVVVTSDLEDHVWGRAYENRIYLNRSAFMAGTKIVAGTLIEEYIHLKHNLRDESRDLQNHLLNAMVSMGELARGEPL
jgi:hypothetical protein